MRTSRSTLPYGVEPPPARSPKRVNSRRELEDFQRFMAHTLLQPLAADDSVAPQFRDGRAMADVAAEFIRPNDRMTSLERLEVYARCYWYRIVSSVYEDCPGLRALLGEKKFDALVKAFLTKYPSRSFTLRNLCSRLPHFIAEAPQWTKPDTALARQIAQFEWAQTHAFDAAALPALTPDDIADMPPARLRVGLQPHITLLQADWPVDDYVIAVKRRESQRAEASNTVTEARTSRVRSVPKPRRGKAYIVIHRYNGRLYYKRLTAPGFSIVSALQAGQSLEQALARVGRAATVEEIREWFSTWMELGWFCRREKSRE